MNKRFDASFPAVSKRLDDHFRYFWIIWAVSMLASLSIAGVIMWAVIRFVLKYT